MEAPFKELARHSAIYGLGQVLSRLASFLLLPVYTTYLVPADYGAIAILDLTAAVIGIVIGSGMGAAVNRHHFDAKTNSEQDQVWWTGLTFVAVVSISIVLPLWLYRETLARLTLGPAVKSGEFLYTLVLPTVWFSIVAQLPDTYLRARKLSGVSVSLNLARLLLNIVLNLYFVVVLNLGIVGILLGNLITGGGDDTRLVVTTLQ